MRDLILGGAVILFGIETGLHVLGGAEHRPKWGHFFTPGGFALLALAFIFDK